MDYEFQIRLAEKELAHLKEMQAIMRSHIDAHDASFQVMSERFERIEANLEKITTSQVRTELNLAGIAEKFNGLIDLLTREHGNGRK